MTQQRLWDPPVATPGAVVRWLGAVQSQEFAYARWSVAQRCAEPPASEVMKEYAAGDLLRTHVLRPTWHLVHRLDLDWLMELTGPRVRLMNRAVNKEWGLDEEKMLVGTRVLAKAVDDGHRSRRELAGVLTAAGLPGNGIPLAQLLMEAELARVLVSGAPRSDPGGMVTHTYAPFGQRVPPSTMGGRDEALARLVLTYFSSRGPATVKDCAAWSGLTMTAVRQGLMLAGDALERSVVEGIEYLQLPDGGAHRAPPPPRVNLIQCYDEYVMGYSATRFHLGGRAPTPGRSQGGVPSHLILLDGRMCGHWKHELSAGGVTIHQHLYRDFPAATRPTLETAVRRYSDFLGLTGRLRVVDHPRDDGQGAE